MKKFFNVLVHGIFIFTCLNVSAVMLSENASEMSKLLAPLSGESSFTKDISAADATFMVSLSSGLSPEGAKVVLVHLQLPDTTYTASVPESGVAIIQDIYPGFYQVYVSRFAYEPYDFKAMIEETHVFETVLMQETLAVEGLEIDEVTLQLSWLAPHKTELMFEEDFSSGSFETQGWTAEPPNWVLNDTIGNEQPSACFMGVPNSSNYSFSLTSRIIELASSPALHLYYDIFLSNYDYTSQEIMAVEIWSGLEWISVHAIDGDGTPLLPWTTETVDISDFSNDDLQFRFRAYGNETNSVEYWSIDNIEIIASDPEFPVLQYHVYLDNELINVTTGTDVLIPPILVQYGQQYTAGVEAIYESGISERTEILFTSFFLPPPKNLVGECIGNDALLNWELPDTLAVNIPEALIGFNIYRDDEYITDLTADSFTFIDSNLMTGTYSYGVTALYDLTFLGSGGTAESLPATVDVLINDFGIEFPFLETWDSTSFAVNDWTIGGNASGNWKITSMKGNPPPAAEFCWDPPINDYESWLMSPPLNAAPYDCADYYIEFDLKLEDRHATGKESLSVQIYANNTWNTLRRFVNSGNTDWESHKLYLPDQSGNTFYIRFLAEGKNSTDIYRWLIDNIYVYAVCRPPEDLRARHSFGFSPPIRLTWSEPDCISPSGELLKLFQWDGPPTNAYFQNFGMAYGVVYNLAAYPDAILEFVDFHHASWGVLGTWNYKIHVVDWDKHELIETLGPFQTTGNDKWENGIHLGQIMGYGGGLVGVMLEPLSHQPTDAYPCFSADNSLSGMSLHGHIPDWSGFTASSVGDFLQNLWIRTAYSGKTEVVKLNPVNPHETNAKTRKLSGSNDTAQMKQSIESLPGLQVTYSQSSLQGYRVYRKEGWDSEFELITPVPVTETEFIDHGPFDIFLFYTYYVTAIYDMCESIPSNEAWIDWIVNESEIFEQDIIQVFPVPADQSLSVVLTDQIRKLQIINIYGQMVYKQRIRQGGQLHIDTSGFPPGAYVVRLYDGKGVAFSRRVIIAR